MNPNDEQEITEYGDPGIRSGEAKIPKWLIATYILLPLWGIVWWYFFWNGSYGWLDPGHWNELQRAANTTFPIINQNDPG